MGPSSGASQRRLRACGPCGGRKEDGGPGCPGRAGLSCRAIPQRAVQDHLSAARSLPRREQDSLRTATLPASHSALNTPLKLSFPAPAPNLKRPPLGASLGGLRLSARCLAEPSRLRRQPPAVPIFVLWGKKQKLREVWQLGQGQRLGTEGPRLRPEDGPGSPTQPQGPRPPRHTL